MSIWSYAPLMMVFVAAILHSGEAIDMALGTAVKKAPKSLQFYAAILTESVDCSPPRNLSDNFAQLLEYAQGSLEQNVPVNLTTVNGVLRHYKGHAVTDIGEIQGMHVATGENGIMTGRYAFLTLTFNTAKYTGQINVQGSSKATNGLVFYPVIGGTQTFAFSSGVVTLEKGLDNMTPLVKVYLSYPPTPTA